MAKICSRCGLIKEFFPNGKSYCRECGNEMCREYKRRNKEKISEYNKKYKENNKEQIRIYNHNYNLENRETIQERQTKTQKERRKIDASFRISKKHRSVLKEDIKREFKMKDNTCNKRYSCDSKFIKEWFEYLFENNMSWDNHGIIWHVDHIKPICSYNLTNKVELKECFHWNNLRPLLIEENQRKTNKIDNKVIEEYNKISKTFLYLYENL